MEPRVFSLGPTPRTPGATLVPVSFLPDRCNINLEFPVMVPSASLESAAGGMLRHIFSFQAGDKTVLADVSRT